MTAEKLIYWETAADTGIDPEIDTPTEPLPVPSFADLWAQYPATTYDRNTMIVHHDPPPRVDTAFMDRVARPVGVFQQSPTHHSPTGPQLTQCVCGQSWPCPKAGEVLSREMVTLRVAEPEWPEFVDPSVPHA